MAFFVPLSFLNHLDTPSKVPVILANKPFLPLVDF